MSKCPYCEQQLSHVNLDSLTSSELFGSGTTWKTIAYSCPYCEKLLNIQIDPVALRTEIIEAIHNK